jgi:hypothetical protein
MIVPGMIGYDPEGNYFMDPHVQFLLASDEEVAGGAITESGYYVFPFCDPMCCRPAGPFRSVVEAREWARKEFCGGAPAPWAQWTATKGFGGQQ